MLARAFWGSPGVIVAVGMNICKLIVRPADEEINSKTEEIKKAQNTKSQKQQIWKEERRSGNGSRKVLKSLYLGA
jgi:hypothetical protein